MALNDLIKDIEAELNEIIWNLTGKPLTTKPLYRENPNYKTNRLMTEREFKILQKYKYNWAPINTFEEDKILDHYALIGWIQWKIKPDENYKGYARLNDKGIGFMVWEERLRSKFRVYLQKIVNFAT